MDFKWLDFKITNRCNNKCYYCGVKHDLPLAPEILTVEEITTTISDAISANFTHIALLGGEPSIREDVEKLFLPFSEQPDITLLVITNGLVFNKNLYEAAFESGAGTVKIIQSFDNFRKPNYKNQDPVQVLKQIDEVKRLSQRYPDNHMKRDIEVHTVISRENFYDFSNIVEYFKRKSIEVSLALVCPNTFARDSQPKEYNCFNYDELGIIINQLNSLKAKGLLNFANSVILDYLDKYPYGALKLKNTCKAGKNHVIISPDGEVYPCITESYAKEKQYANIKERRFIDIYEDLKKFQCNNAVKSACWDHFLWDRLGDGKLCCHYEN